MPKSLTCQNPECGVEFIPKYPGNKPRFCSQSCGVHVGKREAREAQASASREWNPDGCDVVGCGRRKQARGLCSMHYSRWRKYGDVGGAESLQNPGVWRVGKHGYLLTVIGGESVLQHRQVMESVLGRRLAPWENVHHVNGVKDDNRPENLELWVVAQPAGQRAIDLARWVIETYPDLIETARLSA